jgi:uracil-DNA glycosylase
VRTDEDYLREMELYQLFALRDGGVAKQPAVTAPAPAAGPAPARATSTETASAPAFSRRPSMPVSAPIKPAVPIAVPAVVQADPARIAHIATLDWDALANEVAACQACGLCKQRKQAVLGVGAKPAPWLLVGEGPGSEEDEVGEPFVGQAGRLLDAMLKAIGLERGREVYIANVVKCRPPGNRTPTLDEAAACAPFLDRQIDLVQPRLIVALGKTAVMRLTNSDASMASMRGKTLSYRDIPVVATYHPAYLLRNLPEKLKAWEDLQFARQQLAARA